MKERMARIKYQKAAWIAGVVLLAAAMSGCGPRAAVVPDPCTLITLEEIRRIAPDAASANAADVTAEGPIKTCVWKNGSGVEQIRLVSRPSDGSPVEAALKAIMRTQPTVRVAAVPSIGPDAAAAFSGSGDGEITTIMVAQNEKVTLDLRPQAAGIRGEKSQSFAAAASLVKTALERSNK